MSIERSISKLSYAAGGAVRYLRSNSSLILSSVACFGVGLTVYNAYQAGKEIGKKEMTNEYTKALNELIEQYEIDVEKFEVADLDIRDRVNLFAPVAMSAMATVWCIVLSNYLDRRARASLIMAYTMLDRSYREYSEKVKQIFGDAAHHKILSEMAGAHKIKPENHDSPGTLLFYDQYSNRYFHKTMEEVIEAESKVNRDLTSDGYVELNALYRYLGIPEIGLGNELGWSLSAGAAFYCYEWIDFIHVKTVLDDGLECVVIDIPFGPTADYLCY